MRMLAAGDYKCYMLVVNNQKGIMEPVVDTCEVTKQGNECEGLLEEPRDGSYGRRTEVQFPNIT